MKQTLQSFLAIALILGVGFPLWKFVIAVEEPPPQAPLRDLGPVPVEVHAVRPREVVIAIDAFGNLEPRRRVRLAAEVSGRVVAVHPGWRPGALVEEGQLLVSLERTLPELAARAAVAALEESEAGVTTAGLDLHRAERALEMAVAQREIAAREHERLVELGGFASESRRDAAHSARLAAELAEETGRTDLQARGAALRAARARAESARVALARAEEDLARTEIRAPFRGRLRGQPPGLGRVAAPGEPLGELIDPDSLVLEARVPERDLLLLRRGMPAAVGFPSTPETHDELPLTGRVTAIDPASDPLTRRGRIEIELDDARLPAPAPRVLGDRRIDGGARAASTDLLPVGLFTAARVEVERIPDALWIDRRHFVWVDGRPLAYVVADARDPEGSVAEPRVLSLAREHGEGFLLSGGLAPGDRLIVHPLDRLGPGVPVRALAGVREGQVESGGGRE